MAGEHINEEILSQIGTSFQHLRTVLTTDYGATVGNLNERLGRLATTVTSRLQADTIHVSETMKATRMVPSFRFDFTDQGLVGVPLYNNEALDSNIHYDPSSLRHLIENPSIATSFITDIDPLIELLNALTQEIQRFTNSAYDENVARYLADLRGVYQSLHVLADLLPRFRTFMEEQHNIWNAVDHYGPPQVNVQNATQPPPPDEEVRILSGPLLAVEEEHGVETPRKNPTKDEIREAMMNASREAKVVKPATPLAVEQLILQAATDASRRPDAESLQILSLLYHTTLIRVEETHDGFVAYDNKNNQIAINESSIQKALAELRTKLGGLRDGATAELKKSVGKEPFTDGAIRGLDLASFVSPALAYSLYGQWGTDNAHTRERSADILDSMDDRVVEYVRSNALYEHFPHYIAIENGTENMLGDVANYRSARAEQSADSEWHMQWAAQQIYESLTRYVYTLEQLVAVARVIGISSSLETITSTAGQIRSQLRQDPLTLDIQSVESISGEEILDVWISKVEDFLKHNKLQPVEALFVDGTPLHALAEQVQLVVHNARELHGVQPPDGVLVATGRPGEHVMLGARGIYPTHLTLRRAGSELTPLTFEPPQADAVHIIGPNGAGKSVAVDTLGYSQTGLAVVADALSGYVRMPRFVHTTHGIHPPHRPELSGFKNPGITYIMNLQRGAQGVQMALLDEPGEGTNELTRVAMVLALEEVVREGGGVPVVAHHMPVLQIMEGLLGRNPTYMAVHDRKVLPGHMVERSGGTEVFGAAGLPAGTYAELVQHAQRAGIKLPETNPMSFETGSGGDTREYFDHLLEATRMSFNTERGVLGVVFDPRNSLSADEKRYITSRIFDRWTGEQTREETGASTPPGPVEEADLHLSYLVHGILRGGGRLTADLATRMKDRLPEIYTVANNEIPPEQKDRVFTQLSEQRWSRLLKFLEEITPLETQGLVEKGLFTHVRNFIRATENRAALRGETQEIGHSVSAVVDPAMQIKLGDRTVDLATTFISADIGSRGVTSGEAKPSATQIINRYDVYNPSIVSDWGCIVRTAMCLANDLSANGPDESVKTITNKLLTVTGIPATERKYIQEEYFSCNWDTLNQKYVQRDGFSEVIPTLQSATVPQKQELLQKLLLLASLYVPSTLDTYGKYQSTQPPLDAPLPNVPQLSRMIDERTNLLYKTGKMNEAIEREAKRLPPPLVSILRDGKEAFKALPLAEQQQRLSTTYSHLGDEISRQLNGAVRMGATTLGDKEKTLANSLVTESRERSAFYTHQETILLNLLRDVLQGRMMDSFTQVTETLGSMDIPEDIRTNLEGLLSEIYAGLFSEIIETGGRKSEFVASVEHMGQEAAVLRLSNHIADYKKDLNYRPGAIYDLFTLARIRQQRLEHSTSERDTLRAEHPDITQEIAGARTRVDGYTPLRRMVTLTSRSRKTEYQDTMNTLDDLNEIQGTINATDEALKDQSIAESVQGFRPIASDTIQEMLNGPVDMICGRNGAGKTTLFRAMSINGILDRLGIAGLGEQGSIQHVFHYEGGQDEGNMSTFMEHSYELAEMLREVHALVERQGNGDGVLVVIDEFTGTNLKERNIILRAILDDLQKKGAKVWIISHDQVGETPGVTPTFWEFKGHGEIARASGIVDPGSLDVLQEGITYQGVTYSLPPQVVQYIAELRDLAQIASLLKL